MSNYLQGLLLVIVASAVAGCATSPHNTPTYSGDVEAAVMDDVAVVKAAGSSAADYLHRSLSSPMPAWNSNSGSANGNSGSGAGTEISAAAQTTSGTKSAATAPDTAASGVQLYAVAPGGASSRTLGGTSKDRSLSVEAGKASTLKDAGRSN